MIAFSKAIAFFSKCTGRGLPKHKFLICRIKYKISSLLKLEKHIQIMFFLIYIIMKIIFDSQKKSLNEISIRQIQVYC